MFDSEGRGTTMVVECRETGEGLLVFSIRKMIPLALMLSCVKKNLPLFLMLSRVKKSTIGV